MTAGITAVKSLGFLLVLRCICIWSVVCGGVGDKVWSLCVDDKIDGFEVGGKVRGSGVGGFEVVGRVGGFEAVGRLDGSDVDGRVDGFDVDGRVDDFEVVSRVDDFEIDGRGVVFIQQSETTKTKLSFITAQLNKGFPRMSIFLSFGIFCFNAAMSMLDMLLYLRLSI